MDHVPCTNNDDDDEDDELTNFDAEKLLK